MSTFSTLLTYLKAATRYPKVQSVAVTVPRSQLSHTEYNNIVSALEALEGEISTLAETVTTLGSTVSELNTRTGLYNGVVMTAEEATSIGVYWVFGRTGYPSGLLTYAKTMGSRIDTQILISPSTPTYNSSGDNGTSWSPAAGVLIRQKVDGAWSTWEKLSSTKISLASSDT